MIPEKSSEACLACTLLTTTPWGDSRMSDSSVKRGLNRFSRWLLVVYFTFIGGFASWCGRDFVTWPNGYLRDEIVETWRSMAKILETAQVVIPGHGPPIHVDADLLQTLIDGFPRAPHSDHCPDVVEILKQRLQVMEE